LAASDVIRSGTGRDRERRASLAVPEREVRRALREQVARLAWELQGQRASAWPRPEPEALLPGPATGTGGARLLSLAELEQLRDTLVSALADERRTFAERTLAEEQARRLREELLLDPGRHAGARVHNADVGEPGCGETRSEPVGGLLGLLLGWWRVVVSSGCP
jgi:hypothetical protein